DFFLFFFSSRRRHTRFSRDWSSDVCSSDLYQGSSSEALLKGEIKTTQGLGFIDNVIVDTHFVQRGRIGRLFQAVVSNPRTLGIRSEERRVGKEGRYRWWR